MRGPAVALGMVAVLLAGPAAAQEGPRPPCDGAAPVPAHAAPGEPARAEVWTAKPLEEPDLPNVRLHVVGEPAAVPACTGWDATAAPPVFAVALAARFRHEGGADALLGRIAAVSALEGPTYWAAARTRWEPLFERSHAVADPETREPRPDFTAEELRSGRDLHAYQDIGGPVGGAVFRMRAREAGPDRLVVETENATSARVAGLFPLGPGTLRAVHFLDRVAGDEWAYYGLAGLGTAPSSARTYVNRAAGLYRHLAGIPPERDPPVWP